MKQMSRTNLKDLSNRIFERYEEKTFKYMSRKTYINPSQFVKETMGLSIFYYKLSFDGSILGLTSTIPQIVGVINREGDPEPFELDGNTILLDSSLLMTVNEGVRNFTIMHEFAHQILNRMYPDDDVELCVYRNRKNAITKAEDWKEWQADVLASYLLLPDCLLDKQLKKYNYNKVVFPSALSDLARRMHVSKQALSIRLQEKGYRLENEVIEIVKEGEMAS